jgi:hypothetical protein
VLLDLADQIERRSPVLASDLDGQCGVDLGQVIVEDGIYHHSGDLLDASHVVSVSFWHFQLLFFLLKFV